MLEELISLNEINRKPYLMFFWAFLMCSVAILVSMQIAYTVSISGITIDLTGIFSVMFIVIPSSYMLTHLIKREELLEEHQIKEHKIKLWERHQKDITILMFFFFGLTMAFAFWSFMLSGSTFEVQLSKINQIRGGMTGAATVDLQYATFDRILVNNLQVMVFSFLFSFIFGAGAVFIIAWNASVFGVFIGSKLSQMLWHIPLVTLSYLPHAIPEIGGYLCAGLAGGLISAAVLRKKEMECIKVITFDGLKLMCLGALLILVGAGIEAFL